MRLVKHPFVGFLVCFSVCLFDQALQFERLTYNFNFSHEGWPWPRLGWDCRSRSWVKGQGQTKSRVFMLGFNIFSLDIRVKVKCQGQKSRSNSEVKVKVLGQVKCMAIVGTWFCQVQQKKTYKTQVQISTKSESPIFQDMLYQSPMPTNADQ